MSSQGHRPIQKVTLFQFLRDVLNNSMRYGQFPYALFALIVTLIIYRMPAEDISKLVFQLMADLRHGYFIGYISTFFSISGWYYHVRFQRRKDEAEIQRISKEKSDLQQKLINNKVERPKSKPKKKLAKGA